MYLPLRYAALVPYAAAMAMVCVPGLFTILGQSNGVQIIAEVMFALFIAAFAGIFVAVAVIPSNVVAAIIANWFGASNKLELCAILAGSSIILQGLMLFMFADFNRSMAIVVRPDDWKSYAAIVANAGVLCLTALIYGSEYD